MGVSYQALTQALKLRDQQNPVVHLLADMVAVDRLVHEVVVNGILVPMDAVNSIALDTLDG
jgi:hypothetical protein